MCSKVFESFKFPVTLTWADGAARVIAWTVTMFGISAMAASFVVGKDQFMVVSVIFTVFQYEFAKVRIRFPVRTTNWFMGITAYNMGTNSVLFRVSNCHCQKQTRILANYQFRYISTSSRDP